jgi:hypothetical protein
VIAELVLTFLRGGRRGAPFSGSCCKRSPICSGSFAGAGHPASRDRRLAILKTSGDAMLAWDRNHRRQRRGAGAHQARARSMIGTPIISCSLYRCPAAARSNNAASSARRPDDRSDRPASGVGSICSARS